MRLSPLSRPTILGALLALAPAGLLACGAPSSPLRSAEDPPTSRELTSAELSEDQARLILGADNWIQSGATLTRQELNESYEGPSATLSLVALAHAARASEQLRAVAASLREGHPGALSESVLRMERALTQAVGAEEGDDDWGRFATDSFRRAAELSNEEREELAVRLRGFAETSEILQALATLRLAWARWLCDEGYEGWAQSCEIHRRCVSHRFVDAVGVVRIERGSLEDGGGGEAQLQEIDRWIESLEGFATLWRERSASPSEIRDQGPLLPWVDQRPETDEALIGILADETRAELEGFHQSLPEMCGSAVR